MSEEIERVTLGEVYRLCKRIEAKIETQNGRVNALEKDAIRLKTLWAAAVIILGFSADWLRHKIGLS